MLHVLLRSDIEPHHGCRNPCMHWPRTLILLPPIIWSSHRFITT